MSENLNATENTVHTSDGKYTITGIETGHLEVFRDGKSWRDLEGDELELVLALAREIQELEDNCCGLA